MDRRKRPPVGGYSTNKSTVKNNRLRERKTGVDFQKVKDATADNTAKSKFWSKTFLPQNEHVVLRNRDRLTQDKVRAQLRVQSNNVQTHHRLVGGYHAKQKERSRLTKANPGITLPSLDWKLLYEPQEVVFDLAPEFMPPQSVIDASKALQEVDSFNWDSWNEFRDDFGSFTTMEFWRRIQGFWILACTTSLRKIRRLQSVQFKHYVMRMPPQRFKAYVNWLISPNGKIHKVSRRWSGTQKRMRPAMAKALYTRERFLDDDNLPIPPLGLLFTPAERMMMALLFQCQCEGQFRTAEMQLATYKRPFHLPRPYKKYTINSWPKAFLTDAYDVESAQYILEMIHNTEDLMPKDVKEFINLMSVANGEEVEGENNDADEIEGVEFNA